MASDSRFVDWIVADTHWSRAGLPAAALLTCLAPFLRRGLSSGAFSVFVQLPVYLVHQYEEHGHGAFKEYVNSKLLRQRGGISDGSIFIINIVGVWGVDVAALYLAQYRKPTSGLLAPYISIINGFIHLIPVVWTRQYNPGAWTAGLLLLPAGIYSAVEVTRSDSATVRDHAKAFAGGILVHGLAILIILTGRQTPPEGRPG